MSNTQSHIQEQIEREYSKVDVLAYRNMLTLAALRGAEIALQSLWVRVEDGLPTGDMDILALCQNQRYVLWFSGGKFYMSFNPKKYFEDWTEYVTHWAELPPTPPNE